MLHGNVFTNSRLSVLRWVKRKAPSSASVPAVIVRLQTQPACFSLSATLAVSTNNKSALAGADGKQRHASWYCLILAACRLYGPRHAACPSSKQQQQQRATDKGSSGNDIMSWLLRRAMEVRRFCVYKQLKESNRLLVTLTQAFQRQQAICHLSPQDCIIHPHIVTKTMHRDGSETNHERWTNDGHTSPDSYLYLCHVTARLILCPVLKTPCILSVVHPKECSIGSWNCIQVLSWGASLS